MSPAAPAPLASGQPDGTRPAPSKAATMPLPFIPTSALRPLPVRSSTSGALRVRRSSRVPASGQPGEGAPVTFQ